MCLSLITTRTNNVAIKIIPLTQKASNDETPHVYAGDRQRALRVLPHCDLRVRTDVNIWWNFEIYKLQAGIDK
uniref:Uncharacterized protein n=1 Tax=Panagrellus redivivus TaxID=6233 RepID=A0A7E4V073_PANRE